MIKDLINDFKWCRKEFKGDFKKWIPNLLTLFRLLCIIPIGYLTLINKLKLALLIALISSSTDLFDGMLARKFNALSSFGAKIDTIADKLLVIFMLLIIIKTNPIFIIVVVLEILISIVSVSALAHNYESKTLFVGKAKTMILYITTLVYLSLIIININKTLLDLLLYATIILQVATFTTYLNRYLKQKKS